MGKDTLKIMLGVAGGVIIAALVQTFILKKA